MINIEQNNNYKKCEQCETSTAIFKVKLYDRVLTLCHNCANKVLINEIRTIYEKIKNIRTRKESATIELNKHRREIYHLQSQEIIMNNDALKIIDCLGVANEGL